MNKTMAGGGLLAALIAVAVPYAAEAQAHERGVNARQHQQQHRINEGLRQGELTRREYGRLQHEAAQIRREERAYRADGHLSRGERRELHRELDDLSRDIRRERHDGEHRGAGRFPHAGERLAYNVREGNLTPQQARRIHAGLDGHGGGRAIDRDQHRQHERIVRGVRSGELTREEAHALRTEQRAIRAEERAYRADGVLTPAERADLRHDLNAAGRHIYNETHDADRRH
jgi:hypothetical protein